MAVPAGTFIGLRLTRDAPLHLVKSITPTRYGDKVEAARRPDGTDDARQAHGLLNGIDWGRSRNRFLTPSQTELTVDDIRRLAATSAD